ncbi:MAG: thioredoxin peroxidase [Omnitrophica bacterium RIFCSPHIGHO2_02_FULL_63_14]|nr:MAG: thioredoxin peroxidase [Omnitrophica bacterium RIFCSPHIGHO2_02_FULL_63_14]
MPVQEPNGNATLQVGQKAPEFQADALMPDGSFKPVKLSDFRGKWLVVFFYPLDFTFVCPTEIQGFNKKYEDFKKENAEVIAVSTDSVYSHQAWCDKGGLGKVQFPMLGDTSHQISKGFNVLIPEKGIALRGTFIIDPNGVVKSAAVNDLPVGRSIDETYRTLQALKTGKLTGCGWKPGEKTLN